MFLDNENYKLLLIIPCTIKNMAFVFSITFEKTKIQNFSRISPVQTNKFWYKNLTSHTVVEKFCPVKYFNLSHPVDFKEVVYKV